jgi:hypothetical protein
VLDVAELLVTSVETVVLDVVELVAVSVVAVALHKS